MASYEDKVFQIAQSLPNDNARVAFWNTLYTGSPEQVNQLLSPYLGNQIEHAHIEELKKFGQKYHASMTKPDPNAQNPGYTNALATFQQYMQEQRAQLQKYLKMYKKQLGASVNSYKNYAEAQIPLQRKSLWENMYAGLSGRGLEDSESFQAGNLAQLGSWQNQQRQAIQDNIYQMRQRANQQMLSAIGQPDYASLAQLWGQNNNQWKDWQMDMWKRTHPKYGYGTNNVQTGR